MTEVAKEESKISLKKIKKPISSNKSHDGKTVLKDAAERIKRLQRKPKPVDAEKDGKKKKGKKGREVIKRELKRGVVYLGHLPHGFYEDELKGFFAQFGTVTRVKVSRSPKTGKSKGYAFVEFTHDEVAKIVAETMNNYLMFERLVKAQYIPPEKVSPQMFPKRHMTEENYVALNRRNSAIARQNTVPTDKKKMKHLGRIYHRLSLSINNLKKMGIEYFPQVYLPHSATESSEPEAIPQLVPIAADATEETVVASTVATQEEPKSETVAETVPESKSESVAEPKAEAVPEPKAEAVPESKAEAVPETKAEAVPEPKTEAAPEPKTEAAPEPEVKTVPEPEAKTVPAPTAKAGSKAATGTPAKKTAEPTATITPRVTRSRATRKTPSE